MNLPTVTECRNACLIGLVGGLLFMSLVIFAT